MKDMAFKNSVASRVSQITDSSSVLNLDLWPGCPLTFTWNSVDPMNVAAEKREPAGKAGEIILTRRWTLT
jgi:hypothetical protein